MEPYVVVIAQIVNFLILLGLLKWLLFDRIVRAMDEREQKIADRLHDAQQQQEQARREAEQLAQERRRFDADRAEMLDRARQEAEEERKRLTAEAREEVDEQRQRWVDALRQQQDAVVGQLRDRAAESLDRAARAALRDLADADLQQQMVRHFIGRLEDLDADAQRTMTDAIRAAEGAAVVASGEPLSDEARSEITAALKQRFEKNVQPQFKTAPDLIAGIELRAGGRAIGWNVAAYLDGFAEMLRETFEEQET